MRGLEVCGRQVLVTKFFTIIDPVLWNFPCPPFRSFILFGGQFYTQELRKSHTRLMVVVPGGYIILFYFNPVIAVCVLVKSGPKTKSSCITTPPQRRHCNFTGGFYVQICIRAIACMVAAKSSSLQGPRLLQTWWQLVEPRRVTNIRTKCIRCLRALNKCFLATQMNANY